LDVTLADGTILSSAAVSTAAPPPRRYAYCSDTLYMEGLSDRVRQVDLLYHEATFLHDMIDRARETYHSTALQAAQVARDAQVKGLLIGHFSARYKDLQPLLDEALSVFPDTRLAREGDRFSIPLADQPA
jgi:ribonuclease Z